MAPRNHRTESIDYAAVMSGDSAFNRVWTAGAGTTPDALVHQLLAGLPSNYRSILELRFLSGCSVRETAVRLGISVGNARVLQYRALRRAAEQGGDAVR